MYILLLINNDCLIKDADLVLGAVRSWDNIRDGRCLYVLVEETPLTTGPLYITGYSAVDVKMHRKKKLINEKRIGTEREEFLSGPNMVVRSFSTFDYFFNRRCKVGYNPQLFLYDEGGQLDRNGNMANPTLAEDLCEEISRKRSRQELTETSKYPLKI